eukprot:scaffold397470_cov28-Prasinocladus_malaysianus.AAC.3
MSWQYSSANELDASYTTLFECEDKSALKLCSFVDATMPDHACTIGMKADKAQRLGLAQGRRRRRLYRRRWTGTYSGQNSSFKR